MSFDKSRKFGEQFFAAIVGGAIIGLPVSGLKIMDDVFFDADTRTISEQRAPHDMTYLKSEIESLKTSFNNLDILYGNQASEYQQSRGNSDAYQEIKNLIAVNKNEIKNTYTNIKNHVYTNRTLSERDLENVMHAVKAYSPYKSDDADMSSKQAKGIRECQAELSMDKAFVEPNVVNAQKVAECTVYYGDPFNQALFSMLLLALLVLPLSVLADNQHEIERKVADWHQKRQQKKKTNRAPRN